MLGSANGMKVVILCGGLGTRLHEETEFRPKPLVPIGQRPILWHIMKSYAAFGFTDFILALGYKGEMIKDYFLNYDVLYSDFALELGSKRVTPLKPSHEESEWRITFVDTGQETQTGGRLKRLQPYLARDARFMLTYGDGVSDVDLGRLLDFHEHSSRAAVVTGVRPLARWGELIVEGDAVVRFSEKPPDVDSWINGGYFVLTPAVFDYIEGDRTALEQQPLERLATEGQLGIYKHHGYWQAMDTYRELQMLNQQWSAGRAPWTRWWGDEGHATARLQRSA
jgi:glucose-1-phosphate cytidylyltransferase